MWKIILKVFLSIFAFLALSIIIIVVIYSMINKTNGVITSSGHQRKYLLYVPDSYNPQKLVPLIISLHGFAEWPAHQMQISRWNDLADEFGFIVVYPSGTGFPLRWNTRSQPGAASDPMGDVVFISDLIDKLAGEYNIDLTRVYANGLSNGGGMSYLLGCKLSDQITAFGGVAGAYSLPKEDCMPVRSVPVIAFHGTADKIVPYLGSESSQSNYSLPPIQQWVKSWAIRNNCAVEPVNLPSTDEVSGIKYVDCDQDATVIFYTIHGGGHTWPGGGAIPKFIVGENTQDIDATRLMWEFFSQFKLNK